MTEVMPTPVQIQTALNSCYRSGWPTPELFVKGIEPYEDETQAEYVERIMKMGEIHAQRMSEIVVDCLSRPKGLHPVLRAGKLAKNNMTQALYILGYSEEP